MLGIISYSHEDSGICLGLRFSIVYVAKKKQTYTHTKHTFTLKTKMGEGHMKEGHYRRMYIYILQQELSIGYNTTIFILYK